MFRANDKHEQETFFDSRQWMNHRVVAKLEKSWAPVFYEHVFKKIDEEPFAVLYGKTGKPNFSCKHPVIIRIYQANEAV
jgi:hypothetical protein